MKSMKMENDFETKSKCYGTAVQSTNMELLHNHAVREKMNQHRMNICQPIIIQQCLCIKHNSDDLQICILLFSLTRDVQDSLCLREPHKNF